MSAPRPGISLQRRLVASYLLFCLVAVAWLSVGVLFTAQTVLSSRTTGACLARLGRLAASMEIDQLRNEGANLQALTDQAMKEGRLLYCCVVGVDERYLTHSAHPLVGALATMPQGKQLRWVNIDGVQYTDLHGLLVNEYRVTLNANAQQIGTLKLAVSEPSLYSIAGEVARSAPLVMLLPLACVAVGAVALSRMTHSIAGVDQLLSAVARTPANERLQLEATATRGAPTVGWNRLVAYIEELEAKVSKQGSDEKLTQALAARQTDASRRVLDSLREGIAVTDAQGRIDFANNMIESLLRLDDLTDNADASLLEELLASDESTCVNRSGPMVAEVEAPGSEGQRTLRIERQPLAGDGANGQVWSIRDVTQQNLAQQSGADFINAATHELRTPLANIKAYAETLATCDFTDTEQQKAFCNTINTEATRLARFVDELLDISSLEVGALSAQRQNVNVERLLEEAAEKIRPLMASKSIHFDAVIGPKIGELKIDKDKVSAMVVNLLGNAAKYTPDGGEVTLAATAGANHLTIDITDSGVGIAEHELPRVFEKFFRSENPEVADQTGTGLGLALAREIARLHGGDITATSELGAGSTFTITLPWGEGRQT